VHKGLVTLGTDGLSDYVKLSDGTRYNLGVISPLKFVVELTQGSRAARTALDAFLAEGSAFLTVDMDRMWGLLKPRIPRMSTVADPLIPVANRTPLTRQGTTMADQFTKEAIVNQIARIEAQAALLQQRSKEAGSVPVNMRPQIEALMGMVAGLRSPKVAEEQQTQQQAEPEQQAQQKQAATQRASFETFKANTELAGQIIEQLNETNGKIDALVTAGRKFASARAKQDVHSIVAKVSEIVQTVDLAQPWVKADLADLASKSAEIHALFAPAKV
jgi:hypothetical protein